LTITEQGTVALTLFRAPQPDVRVSDRQAAFLKSVERGTEFKVKDFANATDVSERQARRELGTLQELGLVERHGKGPATTYRRTPQPVR
jgi:DeoR/GlpR family transcriptional regulator of sugar metabolism